jgi:excisionase family DNA binding protein
MPERWLSIQEVGEYLQVKRDTLYKWISRRGFPGHKAGRLWRFRLEEVDEWVRTGRDPKGTEQQGND